MHEPKLKRPPLLLRAMRSRPWLYSTVCKARLTYSRYVAGASARRHFHASRHLLSLSEFEAGQVHSLRQHGYALIPEFFPCLPVDRMFETADALFHDLQIDLSRAYSVQTKEHANLQGLSYEELAATEKMIALRDPLLQVPRLIDLAFHESILRIAANFLGYIPPLFRVTLVRDFPHDPPLHSSNFHKDNDEADSLQIFIYLVDIDDTRGPLVYVPGSNCYDRRSCRPRLSRDLGLPANDGRLSDSEVERTYPRNTWVSLRTPRGSIAMIHGNGIHKGPVWSCPSDPNNKPRTAVKLDLHGYKWGIKRSFNENRIFRRDYERMTTLQRLFAHAEVIEKQLSPVLEIPIRCQEQTEG